MYERSQKTLSGFVNFLWVENKNKENNGVYKECVNTIKDTYAHKRVFLEKIALWRRQVCGIIDIKV